jgi:hypothetical protein
VARTYQGENGRAGHHNCKINWQDGDVDYYLIPDQGAIVVEEFTFAPDHTAVALDSLAWSGRDGWCASAVVAKELRAHPSRAVAVTREVAAGHYPGVFPSEDELRARFTEPLPLSVAPPLRLHDDASEIIRVLFAGDLDRAPQIVGDEHCSVELRELRTVRAWAVDVTVRSPQAPPMGPVLRRIIQAMRHDGLIPVTVERLG